MCTINDSHIMYDSWNMECNRQFFCHLGPFLPFYPPPSPPPNQPEKPKFWKWKKCMEMWRYHYFIQMYHKSWYATLFLIYNDRFISYFYFWAIFCPFTPPPFPHHSSSTQKIKIKKRKEKMPGDIIILHISNKNNDHMMYGSCSMVRNGQMDRQIDRKKTYWGGCPT